MLKLKMMLCVMMLPLVVVGCTSKQSVSQCVKPPRPPAWIMRSPDWQTPLNGIISPSERGWITIKTTGRNPEVWLSMSSADRVAHIDGNSCNYCEQYTRAQRGNAAQETEQSIYECLLGFCFNNIFCAATKILAASDSFLLPNSRNEINDG